MIRKKKLFVLSLSPTPTNFGALCGRSARSDLRPALHASHASRATWRLSTAGHLLYIGCINKGKDKTLRQPRLYSSWRRNFAFDRNSDFLLERKEKIMLNKLVTNSNFDDLHSKPWCQIVSKAYSTSKEYCSVNIRYLTLAATW